MRIVFGVVMLAIFCTSCMPDPLDVSGVPSLTPKIVVSSQQIPGQAVAVLLTKSMGALDASDNTEPAVLINQIAVNDAVAIVESSSGRDTLQFLGSGVYAAANITLQAGKLYTLRVWSLSMGEIKASTVVNQPVRFDSAAAHLYPVGRDTLAEVLYGFRDTAGKNWYMINAQHLSGENLAERLLNPRLTTHLMDDTAFEGQVKEGDFKVFTRRLSVGDTLALFLSNISQDYYQFMKLREDTRFGLVDFIGEPVNYPSNVEGGLGFFNLYIPDVRIFILE